MKHFLLSFLICASLNSFLNAQSTYYPMLADSNTWAVYSDMIPVRINPNNNTPTQAWMPGYVITILDTVVDSLTYKKCYARNHEFVPTQWSLLREDTAARKVYILSAGDSLERIIYDYSLNAGDSINLDFMYQNAGTLANGWWRVDSVNTVMIDVGPRRALYLSNPLNPLHFGQPRFMQWIESVGCNISPVYLDEDTYESVGLIEMYFPPGYDFNFHYYSVTCAWHDSLRIYNSDCWEYVRMNFPGGFMYPMGDSCIFQLAGSVNDMQSALSSAQLFPNPSNGKTVLHFEMNSAEEFSIAITNILGETVQLVAGNTWYTKGEHNIEFDVASLPPGIYQVNMIGKIGVTSVRLAIGY